MNGELDEGDEKNGSGEKKKYLLPPQGQDFSKKRPLKNQTTSPHFFSPLGTTGG